jgi:hypothetical protein
MNARGRLPTCRFGGYARCGGLAGASLQHYIPRMSDLVIDVWSDFV